MEGNTCHKRTYRHDSCIYYFLRWDIKFGSMEQVGECKLPRPAGGSSSFERLLNISNGSFGLATVFLPGSFWSGPSPKFVERLTHSLKKLDGSLAI